MSEVRAHPWFLSALFALAAGALTRSGFLLTLGLGLALGVLAAWLWSRYCLRDVSYTVTILPHRVYAGERAEVEVAVVNHKLLPLPWLVVEDQFDRALTVHGEGRRFAGKDHWHVQRLVSIGGRERLRWRYVLECPLRGSYELGPGSLSSGDPFGFFESRREVAGGARVLVYPKPLPLEELHLARRFPFDALRPARALLDDPLNVVGARPYSEGDTRRQVHWRASARSLELQSKVWTPTQEPAVLIFLNLASSDVRWEERDNAGVELAIRAAATVAHQACAAGWAFGLYANGLRPGTRYRTRMGLMRGEDGLLRVMETLAVLPTFATVQFADLLRLERSRVPHGATVAVVTAMLSRPILDQIAIYRRCGIDVELLDVSAPYVEEVAVS